MEDIQKKYNSRIFEEILKEMEETHSSNVLEDTEPQDITESISINLTDETIDKSNCSLIAYGMHVDEDDDVDAYNYKNNPDKAVDILLEYPDNNIKIEIFLDTESKEWDSNINGNCGKLSPEQMEQFFNSNFYKRLKSKLHNDWPEEGDELFSQLNNAIDIKRYRIDGFENSGEEDQIDEESGKNDFGTGSIDRDKSREKNASGRQIRSRSGRKYIHPSDLNVKHGGEEAYFCWPAKNREFKWSQWKDWEKIKPLARMRFEMSNPDHVYGISISPLIEKDKNRGFRGYDLTAQPPLQYLTPEETQEIMRLTIVQKFLKNIKSRIQKYLSIPDQEIFEKVGQPDRCTIEDIRKTKRVISNALEAIKNSRADTYIYT